MTSSQRAYQRRAIPALLNVADDVTRERYKDINPAFTQRGIGDVKECR